MLPVCFALIVLVTAPKAQGQPWNELLARADSLAAVQQTDSAIACATGALNAATNTLGTADTSVARILRSLGTYNLQASRLDEASAAYERACRILEDVLGPDDLEVARVLLELGYVKLYAGQFDETEALYKRALEIRRHAPSPESTSIASCLYGLATLYMYTGRHAEARSSANAALRIWTETIGPDAPDVFQVQYVLGTINVTVGRFHAAVQHYREALRISESSYGPDHAYSSMVRVGLSAALRAEGNLGDAMSSIERALAAYRTTIGNLHPEVAQALINLANIHNDIGAYAEAQAELEAAAAIFRETLGENHLEFTYALDGLAYTQWAQGRLNAAESLFAVSLTTAENALGADNPFVSKSLNNLASVNLDQGRLDEARAHQERGLKIATASLGPKTPQVAVHLAGLADILVRQDRFIEADSLYRQALTILESSFGKHHPEVAQCLEFMSVCYHGRGRDNEGLEAAMRATEIREQNLRDFALIVSERDALMFSHSMRRSVDYLLTSYLAQTKWNPSLQRGVIDLLLNGKGAISDVIFQRTNRTVLDTTSKEQMTRERLQEANYQLAQLYVIGAESGADEDFQTIQDSLQRIVASCEAGLARAEGHTIDAASAVRVQPADVISALPSASVLLEYVRYSEVAKDRNVLRDHYLAVILDSDGQSAIVQLGDAAEIDQLIQEYQSHIQGIAARGLMPSNEETVEYRAIAHSLYNRLWAPLTRFTRDRSLVFVAPDGNLNLLPFSTLVDGTGQYLIENTAVHYLSAGRDLIRLEGQSPSNPDLLAVGDPDFDATVEERKSSLTPESPGIHIDAPATRGAATDCLQLKDLRFRRLPGTRKEIETVSQLWRDHQFGEVHALVGAAASEDAFKSLAPGAGVIHIATHGYFLQTGCYPHSGGGSSGVRDLVVRENPLLFSGLFLSGGNLHGENAKEEKIEDGVLTASEVASLDLRRTHLVVLSACESGLGTVLRGEGVYGLRRAFLMAGTRTVISTLWSIADDPTAQMLSAIYDVGDNELYEQIRSSKLDWIELLRTSGIADHPYTWGAFIAVGDWR